MIPVEDLDKWRNQYPTASHADQVAFHSRIWDSNPHQNHFDADECALAIDHVKPTSVVELGGWDGELAGRMLTDYQDIRCWINVELCQEAAQSGRWQHPGRYHAPHLEGWYWAVEWKADLFVASHVIEHLTAHDLSCVIAATNAPAMFLDAPLFDAPTNWSGTTTTHILELGWEGVTDLMARHGYTPTWAHDHQTAPSSGDHARACLYQR